MEIDLQRWHRVLDELLELHATHRGLNAAIFELEGRHLAAARDLALLERRRPSGVGAQPAAGVTLPSARAAAAAAAVDHRAMLDRVDTRDSRREMRGLELRAQTAHHDVIWLEAQQNVTKLDGEVRRLRERQAAAHRRVSMLEHIVRQCRDWARRQTPPVHLPGDGDERRIIAVPGAPAAPSLP